MIKCIISDLDGTLLTRNDTIEENTLKQLKKLISQGVEFVIATGRDINMVVDLLDKFDFECTLILNNGTQIRNRSGSFNDMHPMDDQAFLQIGEILKQYGYLLAIHTTDGMYSFHDDKEFWEYHIRILLKNMDYKSEAELPDKTFYRKNKYLRTFHPVKTPQEVLDAGVRVLKIDARHDDAAGIAGVKAKLNIPHLSYSSSFEDNIEITTDEFHKGKMIREYAKKKGYQEDEIAVFGDGDNDAQMLSMFPYTFAPSNGSALAREKAGYVMESTCVTGFVGDGIQMLSEKGLL